MNLKEFSLVTIIVVLSFGTYASAIDCWVCTSADAGCGESINEGVLQDYKRTSSGCVACGKTFKSLGTIWTTTERTCLSIGTDSCDNKLGYGECVCTTTFCNGQSKLEMKSIVVLLISMFVSLLLLL